jgi:Flp pilus assembly protein TadD
MTNETRNDPRGNFTPRFLPWLLAAAALAVYWLTLNRWVSLLNIAGVTKISGWQWSPEYINPVLFTVTYPLRWLPEAAIPMALNLFSAVCAALTLGLLARSVAILPHDRTEAQRQREQSDFSFLTTRTAWLPPILAVAVCGLQLTFWQHATNFTGEMFDLLMFAFIVWSLVEYRLDEREGRLYAATFVYGAGLAENWAMVGFLPVFVTALIWLRKLSFFNITFLGRTFLCGLAGTLFYLLLPLLTVMSGKFPITFWQVLQPNLAIEWHALVTFFTLPGVRHNIGLISLTTLLPVFMLAIRWKSSFGDSSQLGTALAGFMFHVVHAVILCACIWVAFDPPFSPHNLGYGSSCLTFSYLGALSVGYFSGYFLLLFGKAAVTRSQRPERKLLQFLNPCAVAGVFVLAALAIAGLIYKNTPQIRSLNDNTLSQYASLVEENLPRTGGIVLSDSDNPNQDQPWRLFAVQAALTRDGRANDFLLLDTKALAVPAYHRYLHRKFPQRWPQIVSDTDMNELNPHGLFAVLNILSKTNEIFYLHPSYGYYFEQFYQEPHGLVYKLKPLPEDTFLPPLPDKNLIAENEAFWSRAETDVFPKIEKEITPPVAGRPKTLVAKMLKRLHMQPEQNPNPALVGTYFSRDLDFWGVQLQRAGELEQAAARFDTAQKLNPDNVVAQINLQFNQNLRAGISVPVDLSTTSSDRFGKWHNWMEVTDANGPFDEPSFCFQDGLIFIQNTFLRQAMASFTRVSELATNYLPARLLLAQLCIVNHLPDRALDALHDPLTHHGNFSLGDTNSTEVNILAAGAYLQKNDLANGSRLIELEISRHPDNSDLLNAAAKSYMVHGQFTNALAVMDRQLRLTPDDPTWLYGRGLATMQIKAYGDAIAAFSRVLAIQTNNYDALFNRAVARLQSEKFDAARADYLQLQQVFTNSFQIAYGLGEIAWRNHDNAEAIRNYAIYLANANTNTAEAKTVRERLVQLQGK